MASYGGMYGAHLDMSPADLKKITHPKPIFRSSAIFPVFHMPGVSSRFLFMGYWIIKRHIDQVGCVVTLRSLEGQVLSRTSFTIKKPKAYSVELTTQLEKAKIPFDKQFVGSFEIEVFSSVNLFFSFPAGVINYYGPNFSTFVHSAQRVFNDIEDMTKFSSRSAAESGFNIYADGNREPFISLINGIEARQDYKVQMEFINIEGQTLEHEFLLGDLLPYQTHIIYPEREVDLQGFLKGQTGTVKVQHHLNWVYSRLVVGNIQKSPPGLSITHSFLDSAEFSAESDYWRRAPSEWHNATLMIPVIRHGERCTNVQFYPIYSPSEFRIDVEIYTSEGIKLNSKENVLNIISPSSSIQAISFKTLCEELDIETTEDLTARIIATPKKETLLPARVKIGLDVNLNPQGLPCNICTNLYPFNPKLETKPRTFRWLPIMMDQEKPSMWITNSSAAVEYTRVAHIELIFFRESDDTTFTRRITIQPNGFCVLYPQKDSELEEFLDNTIGWMVVKSSSPHVNTYYFVEGSTGIVGGDHGF